MRPKASLFAICLSMLLGGCGNLGLCTNKCAPGLQHNLFCGCVDWSGDDNPVSPGSSADNAACLCKYENGLIGGWFTYQPAAYGRVPSHIEILAPTCRDLSLCALLPNGGGSDSYTFITGRVGLDVSAWQHKTNLLNGSQLWSAYGSQSESSGLLEQRERSGRHYSPVTVEAGIRLAHLQRVLIASKNDNSVEGCRTACRGTNHPFCYTQRVVGAQADGLKKLRALLREGPAKIEPSALLAMFGMSKDPCDRGETTIKNGVLTNTGEACFLTNVAPDLDLKIQIDVPLLLQGAFEKDLDSTVISFENEQTRARLHFKPIDEEDLSQVKNAKFLDDDWGGDIQHVFSDPDGVGFSVGDKSCVLAILN